MISYIDRFIIHFASLRNTLLLLFIFLAFNFAVFPFLIPENSTVKPLDLQYLYTAEQAYSNLEQMSPAERKTYLIAECTVDVIYPLVYTLMLCFSIFLLYQNLSLSKLPILILVADFIENAGIIQLLRKYPEQWNMLANFTGVVSAVKWLLALIAVILTLLGLVKLVRKTMFRE